MTLKDPANGGCKLIINLRGGAVE